MPTYDPALTMREARARYFEDNDFGPDGGYASPWVDIKLGPIPMPFPNTDARRRAVRYHDLHHVLTGYATDWTGEFEISAWEIAAGCKDFVVAWQLNLGGMGAALALMPRKAFRAFVRGRRSESLYGKSLDELLDLTVAEARARTNMPETGDARATVMDVVLFVLAGLAGIVVGSLSFVVGVALLPVAIPGLHLAKARSAAADG